MKNIIIKCLFVVFFLNSCVSSQKIAYDECDQSNFDREPNALKCESLWKSKKSVKPEVEINSKNPVLVPEADIYKQLIERYDSPNINTLSKWISIYENSSEINQRKDIKKQVHKLLSDESLSSYHILLEKVLNSVFEKGGTSQTIKVNQGNQAKTDMQIFQESIYEVLKKVLPEYMAKERSEILLKENITYDDLLFSLGQLSHEQSLEALIGKNGINQIDSRSLIGQYITQSKELYNIDVATLVDSFKLGPDYQGRGPEKLFIAVDKKNMKLIANILQDPHHLFHDYSPGQGTLQLAHNGKNVNYASYSSNNVENYPNAHGIQGFAAGKLLPLINLSSVEASNAINYFTLGSLAGQKFSKYPWGYAKVDPKNPEKMENYCKKGGYSCCTHWVGEAPLGEKFVDEYSFPGDVDRYARSDSDTRTSGENSSDLRTGPVGGYTHFNSRSGIEEIGTVQRSHRLSRIVWTDKQGRQQLWDMVGDKDADALKKAEWVNPGWVLYSFLTKTSQLKVPLVFVLKTDASKLDRKYLDQLTGNISSY